MASDHEASLEVVPESTVHRVAVETLAPGDRLAAVTTTAVELKSAAEVGVM